MLSAYDPFRAPYTLPVAPKLHIIHISTTPSILTIDGVHSHNEITHSSGNVAGIVEEVAKRDLKTK